MTCFVRGAGLGPALWALALWVVFLNGGTLAINSVFDKDEGDIGYLVVPPPLPRYLLAFSVGMELAILVTTLLLGVICLAVMLRGFRFRRALAAARAERAGAEGTSA